MKGAKVYLALFFHFINQSGYDLFCSFRLFEKKKDKNTTKKKIPDERHSSGLIESRKREGNLLLPTVSASRCRSVLSRA